MKSNLTTQKTTISSVTMMILLLFFTANLAAQSWTVYDGSVMPNGFDPVFATSSGGFNETENEIIDDTDHEGNKLLRMDINGNPNAQFLWRMNFLTHEIDVTALTLVIRAKGHPERDMALDVDMDFNGKRSRVSILNSEVPEARIRNGSGDNVMLDVDVTAWNIYRFIMSEDETRLYMNEDPDPVMVFTPATGSNRHFRFGDGDSGRSFGADIDWVIWDITGAFSPEEGLAIPEYLLQPEVVAEHHWNIYDGSVFPNQSVPTFITASGAFSENENAIIDDPDNEDNKLLRMDVSGNPNVQFLWRMNFLAQGIELDALTLVIRAKGNPDKELALDVDMDFNGKRSRVSIHNLEVNEARIRNGTGENALLDINVLEWNTYRFTMTDSVTHLYLNEETDPVLVFAPVTAGSNRHFRFGDGDSGRAFGADIDWVIWDITGAYAPGEGSPVPDPVVTPNWDASLSELMIDGVLIDNFDPELVSYEVALQEDTASAPLVSANPNDSEAKVVITQAGEIPGEATVAVTAANRFTTRTYTVAFRFASSDATLADLLIDNETVAGFSPSVTTYAIELPLGTTLIPVVSAVAADSLSTVTIQQAEALPGEATVTVTAENGHVITYTIKFTRDVTSARSPDGPSFKVYPNPSASIINIERKTSENMAVMRLLSIHGQEIMRLVVDESFNSIDISHLTRGMYILQLNDTDGISKQIIIKQ